jgi:hypothetical protein
MAVNPTRPTTKEPFAPGALYEFRIDNNGDAIADITYSVQFSSRDEGKQTATLRRILGASALGAGEEGKVIVKDAPVSTGKKALTKTAGDYQFFAGWRSDSFFFDADGLFNNMQFGGTISSPTRMFAASCLNCPTPLWGPFRLGFGLEQSTRLTKVGFRQTEVAGQW